LEQSEKEEEKKKNPSSILFDYATRCREKIVELELTSKEIDPIKVFSEELN
jgi:hypothetical protein